jgi:hypothetical protein
VITKILAILAFEFWNIQRKLGGNGGPCRIMTHRVIHQLRQVWQIEHGQKRETGLQHLAPHSLERLWLGNCIPSRVLVSTMALSRIVRPSSRMIHKGGVGHHSSRNVLMRVIKISPIRSGPRLGVAQSVKLTSSRCESRG